MKKNRNYGLRGTCRSMASSLLRGFGMILVTVAGLVSLNSCGDDLTDIGGMPARSGNLRILVEDEHEGASTRMEYDGFKARFEDGDAIGVYVVNGTVAVCSNVKFTLSAGEWTAESDIPYNSDWTYLAYYPYVQDIPYSLQTSGTTADARFSAFVTDSGNRFQKADQSTWASFSSCDYMHALGVKSGENTVRFTMAHKKALAVIVASPNKWYDVDDPGTKVSMKPIFTGNIPYTTSDGDNYFLMKANTSTSVGGTSMRAGAGKYTVAESAKLTAAPSSWQYATSTDDGATWSGFSSGKPNASYLALEADVMDGYPVEIMVEVKKNVKTSSVSLGTGFKREVAGDAVLKAASPVSDVDLSMVNNDGTARASRMTANCYLVHAPGTYKVPLVYGNAIKDGDESSTTAFYTDRTSNTLQRLVDHNDAGITTPWIKSQIGSCPDGAQLVWEDVKGMISSVGIDPSGNGYLTFTVDEENIAVGNAVIAATLGGTVVWSWHIWVTDETLSDLTSIDTGSHTNLGGSSAPYKVAPVNVGQVDGTIAYGTIYKGYRWKIRAISSGVTLEFEVSSPDYLQASSTYYNPSPYFQWGRKDAMYPNTGGYNSSGTLVTSYRSGTTLITDGSTTTPGSTIQHPDYWYYNSSNNGPYGTNSTYAGKYNYWDMNQTSTDNIKTATVKTVYDPCPPDFCVPTGNLYYYADSNSGQTAWQSTPPGRNWTVNGTPVFFPASGYRSDSDGSLNLVGSDGYSWSASANSGNYGRSLYFNSGSWYWDYDNRADGFPVRAVAEE